MRATLAAAMLLVLRAPATGQAADDLTLWKDFSQALREDRITTNRIRPYYDHLRGPLLRFIANLRAQAKPEDWNARPEIHRVRNQVHFLIPLTVEGGKKTTYCFTVVEEQGTWFFQHLEAIFIRLDQVGPLPVSRFPDVSEGQKNWMREEQAMTERLRLFRLLAKEKGRDFAFDWFKDGRGYFLAARTWVPFVPAARAFVLYLCWEQTNLRGSPVTLEVLSDDQAVVRIDAVEWRLYRQTAHLSQMVSLHDYRALFETVWQDRAAAAGWNLQIACDGSKCTFQLRRAAEARDNRPGGP